MIDREPGLHIPIGKAAIVVSAEGGVWPKQLAEYVERRGDVSIVELDSGQVAVEVDSIIDFVK